MAFLTDYFRLVPALILTICNSIDIARQKDRSLEGPLNCLRKFGILEQMP